jgi:hypothetical protein
MHSKYYGELESRGRWRRNTGPEGIVKAGAPALERRRLLGGKVQLAPDLYGPFYRPSDRAAILVHFEHALYGLAVFFVGGEVDSLRDPL